MKISDTTFTIVTNGFADGPAQPLRDYLLQHKAMQLIVVSHPLVAEGSNKHTVEVYKHGKLYNKESYNLPNKPPYTFGLDPFVPLRLPPSDAWFGFNNLAALRGLRRRKQGKAQKVFYWAVDFVPNRFGSNPLTKIYNSIDKKVCVQADARIELSEAAIEGRTQYLKLHSHDMAPTVLAPMGTWLARTPKIKPSAWKSKRIVYLGHLVERQGVNTLVEAMGIIRKKHPDVSAEIIGSGPELDNLKKRAKDLKIDGRITFHGFVKSHEDVEKILASGTLAAAPYVKDENNFTQFADPGKLKAYLGASLPIVLTDVPPNAKDLEKAGAAFVLPDSPEAFAKKISELLTDQRQWVAAHRAAVKAAKEFDWETIMKRTLAELNFQ